MALSKKVHAPLDSLEIEAKAFEASLSFASDVGILEFIIEGDSWIMSQALAEKTSPPALVAPMIYGILSSLHDIHKVIFSHVGRVENRPAHLLDKYTFCIFYFSIWIEERLLIS